MKVLVFGATGPTGKLVVDAARAAGHEVTAFTREEQGDVTAGRDAVGRALRGQDAAISALGRGKSPRSKQLMSRAMDVILPAMRREGVRRLIVTSAFGVDDEQYDRAPFTAKLFFRLFLRHIYADKAIADDFVRESGLDWTIVCPTRLIDGPRTGDVRAGEHIEVGKGKISRADTAEFLVRQVTDDTWVRKTVVISY